MNEVMDVASAFTTPLKVAWIVWLAWGIGQMAWYRHQRAHAMAPKASARPSRAASRPGRTRHTEAAARMITPAHVEPAPRQRVPQPPAAAQMFERGGANESLPSHVRQDRAATAFDRPDH